MALIEYLSFAGSINRAIKFLERTDDDLFPLDCSNGGCTRYISRREVLGVESSSLVEVVDQKRITNRGKRHKRGRRKGTEEKEGRRKHRGGGGRKREAKGEREAR